MPKSQVNKVTFVDAKTVEDFLVTILCRDQFHIYSIDPNKNAKGKTGIAACHTKNFFTALDFVKTKQALGHGIYYAINLPRSGCRRKPKKADVEWLDAAHTDIDPPPGLTPSELSRWQRDMLELILNDERMPCSPSFVVMSGSGIQPVWLLKTQLHGTPENIDRIETINQRLSAAYGGDHCFNIDRVFRLPGTTNFATEIKKKIGRKDAPATLAYVSGDANGPELFTLDDFDGLPSPLRKADVVAARPDKDYLTLEYSESYEPFTTAEMKRDRPDIYAAALAALDNHGDRSEAAFGFIASCAEHIQDVTCAPVDDLAADENVQRNLAALLWDSDLDFLSHYDEKTNPELKATRDVAKALAKLVADKRMPSPANAAKNAQKAQNAVLAAKPVDLLATQEARRLFIEYVQGVALKSALPNAVGGKDDFAAKQILTEANLRQILLDAQITCRWDMMRDECRFIISEAAGAGEHRGKPREWFARALSRTPAVGRSRAEISLLIDAIAQLGIHARDGIEGLLPDICREDAFHPMEDYCLSVPWDGKRRIRGLAKHLKTTHPLAGRYLEIFFRQGVAVVLSLRNWLATGEGEAISTITILQGPQGIGKTRFWNKLFPPYMRSEGKSLKLGQAKETDSIAEVLSGVFANLDEIETSLMRSDHAALKNFMSATLDRYRTAWARVPVIKPRMTQFVGTSNAILLHDQTGTRRFNILTVEAIVDFELSDAERQQLFAEAWHDVVECGATWWLEAKEESTRDEHNAGYTVTTSDQMTLTDYLTHADDRCIAVWASATQICKLLDIRFTSMMWPPMRDILEAHGLEFRNSVVYDGKLLRKVYSFPVLPDRWASIVRGV